ncbi:MAG: hypothetical protein ACE5FD_01840 [Anaerolineae bacterium]
MDFQKESYLMTYHRQSKLAEMAQKQDINGIISNHNASRRLETRLNKWFRFLGKLKNMRIQVTFDPPERQESRPINDVLIL